jgi:hypothetical protein
MTRFATFSLVLLLSSAALADTAPPPRSETMKIRFSLRDGGAPRDFSVIASTEHPCATVSQRSSDRDVELKACATRDAHLGIEWRVRVGASEYHSTSSIPFEHGATADLGSSTGPRLTVTVE